MVMNFIYKRDLYRIRWKIKIFFRDIKRIVIKANGQERDKHLVIMGIRSLLYNIWKVHWYLLIMGNPKSELLELEEFLGYSPKLR